MEVATLVLLAGGRGTRLSELTRQIPKPAALVNGRPLITYLIDWAQENDLKKVIVCGGYLFNKLEQSIYNYYKNQSKAIDLKLQLEIIDTGLDEKTGQRLRLIQEKLLEDEYFLCTYADTLSDVKVRDILQSARNQSAQFQLTLGRPDARYGEIIINDGLVTEFKEKAPPDFLVNRGFYIFHRSIFKEIQFGESLEENVLPRLAVAKKLHHYISSSWFHSVDSIMDLENLEKKLNT